MAKKKSTKSKKASEAQIAVHWREEDLIHPSAQFIAQANMTDPGIFDRFSLDNFPECFKEYADLLDWYEYWHTTLDTSDAPCWKWFVGGKINASYNCVDRHLPKYKNKAAIHFVPEPEDEPPAAISYQELYVRVNEFAALLRDFAGLKKGDRVTLHMPMTPELPVTMLACARLGVIHSEVFGGFSGQACADRIVDSGSNVLITVDSYHRGGNLIDHKVNADIAIKTAKEKGQKVDKVLIWQRYPGQYNSESKPVKGRDYIVNEGLEKYRGKRVEPVKMPAED
ncbi:MAG: AMP-binding protein, partial [Rhodospirillales bacterium]